VLLAAGEVEGGAQLEATVETVLEHADVDLALCPEGTKAGGERCSGQM
jgi:hypothetical protein